MIHCTCQNNGDLCPYHQGYEEGTELVRELKRDLHTQTEMHKAACARYLECDSHFKMASDQAVDLARKLCVSEAVNKIFRDALRSISQGTCAPQETEIEMIVFERAMKALEEAEAL